VHAGDQKYAGVIRERGGTYIAKYESKDKSKPKKERMLRQTGLPSADEAARVANAWMHADRQFTCACSLSTAGNASHVPVSCVQVRTSIECKQFKA
jgi:hypothetical protein